MRFLLINELDYKLVSNASNRRSTSIHLHHRRTRKTQKKNNTSIKYITNETKTNKTWKIVTHLERSRACNGISHNWYTAKMFAVYKSGCQCCCYKFAGCRRERTWLHLPWLRTRCCIAFLPRAEYWENAPLFLNLPTPSLSMKIRDPAGSFQ